MRNSTRTGRSTPSTWGGFENGTTCIQLSRRPPQCLQKAKRGMGREVALQKHKTSKGAQMSRHEIPAKNPAHQVFVGWDHPLLTFFVQVYDRVKLDNDEGKEFDPIVFWKGARPRELYEVEDLARVVNRFAHLTADMRSKLYGDKDEGK